MAGVAAVEEVRGEVGDGSQAVAFRAAVAEGEETPLARQLAYSGYRIEKDPARGMLTRCVGGLKLCARTWLRWSELRHAPPRLITASAFARMHGPDWTERLITQVLFDVDHVRASG